MNVIKFEYFVLFFMVATASFFIRKETSFSHDSVVAILSFIALGILIMSGIYKKKISAPQTILLLFSLFFIWIVLSLSHSVNFGDSIRETLKMISFFALFIAVYNLIRIYPKILNTFTISFAAIGSLLVANDLYNYILIGDLKTGAYLAGSFNWHNQMAGFLLFVIPILLALLIKVESLFLKFLTATAVVLSILAMVFTYSRGGWISLAAGLLLFGFFSYQTLKKKIKLLIIPLILCVLVPLFVAKPQTISKQTQSIIAETSSSTRTVSGTLRTTVWKNSLDMIKSSLIFGLGPGTFGSSYYSFQKDPWLYSSNAHNYFLEIAAELGIPGLLIFLSILAVAVWTIYKKRKELFQKENLLLLGVVSSLFSVLIHGLLDMDFARVSLYSLFWIFLAILFSQTSKKEAAIRLVGFKKLLFLIPLFFMAVSAYLLLGEEHYQSAQSDLRNSRVKAAELNINQALSINPYNGKYYFLLGNIKEIEGKLDQAKGAYKNTIMYSKLDSLPYYRLGTIEFRKQNYHQAERLFSQALDLGPYSELNYYLALANTYANLGQLNKAESTLQTAVNTAFPLNESFHGFEYLYEATGFKKDLANAYLRLALIETQLGKRSEAKKLLQIAQTKLDPKNSAISSLEKKL